jgi:cytochrome c2
MEYQREYKTYLEEHVGTQSASSFEFSVKQIWLPELAGVDRCVSCHLGYDNPGLVDAPQPFTAHPDIEPHPFLKMGCTICHGGQGYALKKENAHGEIEYWDWPLLGTRLAKKYGLSSQRDLIQINCNICHRHEEETVGMGKINLAKKLITQKKKCQTCHIIHGKGGTVGPDLTFVGDKPAERFDFSRVTTKLIESEKPLSMLSWHFEHFMDPKAVVQDSKMPFEEYSVEEAWALSLLMMSWKNINLPIMLVPKEKPPAEEPVARGKLSQIEWGKQLFESKYCSVCHTIGGGVEVGPDLKGVTRIRSVEWLKRMILDPEGMEQTDPIVKELYLKYEGVGMSAEEMTDEEVEAIIEYIASF